ncbi:MAG: acyltransferase [Actinobacteria bacterium]|nr:MAG: acyltransferase [Actinomycetota bacterium]
MTTSALPRSRAHARGTRLAYVPGLDGLRALAVLAVVAYHAPASWARGGYLGVDVFFVISGYLITSLLLAEHDRSDHISMRQFWGRRARRLLPPLFLVLAVLAAWAAWWADPVAQHHFRGDALSALGYHANWHFVVNGASYFDRFSPSPIRHLWSLAVEEQFYLVWPLVVAAVLILLRKRVGRRAIGIGAFVGAAASAAAMALLFHGGDASRVYYGTDTHAFGLLLGAAVATTPLWFQQHRIWRWLGPPALGGLLLLLAKLEDTSDFAYRGGMALAVLLTVPVILAACQNGPLARAFSWRPVVAIGLVSYGIYLWHWPIWIIVTPQLVHVEGAGLTLIRIAILATTVVGSYFLVELPVRSGALGRGAALVLAPVAAAVIAALVIISTVAPPLFVEPSPVASATPRGGSGAREPRVALAGDSTAATAEPGFVSRQDGYDPLPLTPPEVGPLQFCPLDQELTGFRFLSGEETHWEVYKGCRWKTVWPNVVRRYEPAVTVLMFSVWDALPHEVGGRWLEPGTTAWSSHMGFEVSCAVSILGRQGGRVLILRADPTYYGSSPWTQALNDVFDEVQASQPDRVRIAELPSQVRDAGFDARYDGIHYAPKGASMLFDGLNPTIKNMLAAPRLPPTTPTPGCPA